MNTADTFNNNNNFQDGWETPISVAVDANTSIETMNILATALEKKLLEQGASASVSINENPDISTGFKSLDVTFLSFSIDSKNLSEGAITLEAVRSSKNSQDLFRHQIDSACKSIDSELIETVSFNSDRYGNQLFSSDNLSNLEN
jgi:hypothetical protein